MLTVLLTRHTPYKSQVVMPDSEVLNLHQLRSRINCLSRHINYHHSHPCTPMQTYKAGCRVRVTYAHRHYRQSIERLKMLELAKSTLIEFNSSYLISFSLEHCAAEVLSIKMPLSPENQSARLNYIHQLKNSDVKELSLKMHDRNFMLRFENAIYGWIQCAHIEQKEAKKILRQFYELSSNEKENLNVVEQIINGTFYDLYLAQLFTALRFCVLYHMTPILHSFEFGIKQRLKDLDKHVSQMHGHLGGVKLKAVKWFISCLLVHIDALNASNKDEYDKNFRHIQLKWTTLKLSWKESPDQEMDDIQSHMTSQQFSALFNDEFSYQLRHKVMLARAWKIKQMLQLTHITFIHGQSTASWVYNQTYKKIQQLMSHPSSLFHYLRFIKNQAFNPENASIWRNKINFNDHQFGTELLSVDANYLNHLTAESANCFVAQNWNVHTSASKHAFLKYLDSIHFDTVKHQNLCKKLLRLASKIIGASECGNLYVIAIPISEASSLFYPCHPLGIPCKKLSSFEHRAQLSAYQGEHLTPELNNKCSTLHQYRIITSLLNPTSHRIFLLPGFENKKYFKTKVNKIAKKIVDVLNT